MMSHYDTHKHTRYSDSSQYDEVCEDCGLTDGKHASRNMDNTPCPEAKRRADTPISRGIEAIAAERRRQIEAEGWTPEHDDGYDTGELARAAACYAAHANDDHVRSSPPPGWPWDPEWWKPSTTRRDLVKAGALIAAEIDRLDRSGY